MSVNRILKKRRQQASNMQGQSSTEQQRSTIPQFSTDQPKIAQQQAKLQQQFQAYAGYSQSNPAAYQFSNTHLPYNASLYSKFKLPISIFLPPVTYQMPPVEQSIDKIPRCGVCRAYMNYYNQLDKRNFICFVCGKQSMLGDYVVDANNIELSQPSYHVIGGQNIYTKVPPQNSIVFLIDLNVASFQCKMLYYFVAAAKQVLSREEFNQTQIYFFTYDDVVHEYDFSGDQVKCTVFDPTIKNSQDKVQQNFLSNIRTKLFNLFDSLQQIAEHNRKQGSNFFQAFSYVYETVKNTGAKIFIFQSNQAISGQTFANEYLKSPNIQGQVKPKSLLQTRNKTLFNTFVQPFTKLSLSFSFFVFQRNFKNLRVFGDMAKVTNSQILSYRKDTNEDLMKFYYDLSYILGASYYSDVRMQLIISPGWYFTAVYGNVFRIREHITFKMCHLQPSKRVCVTFLPQESIQLPYCAIQVVSNYLYNRQHFVTVNTMVLPLTTSLEKLYTNQNYSQSAATLQKVCLSGLRLQDINLFRNKTIKNLAILYKTASQFYKKKVSPDIINLLLSQLGLLKSLHFQIQTINDSIALDTIVTQRNFLQSCGINEVQNFFSPYLFNLSSMAEDTCVDAEAFTYPQICELKFSSVKEGVYLLDNGLSLYLYFSKGCDPLYLKSLFGKDKFAKGQQLSEDMFLNNTLFSQQVGNLIKVCREQKSYGWIPLYIVRCGENSYNEKLFYMNFYAEKYDEFRAFKLTLSEFIAMLSQQY